VLRSTRAEVPILPAWENGLDGYLHEIRAEALR
jgi:hypothetical protein